MLANGHEAGFDFEHVIGLHVEALLLGLDLVVVLGESWRWLGVWKEALNYIVGGGHASGLVEGEGGTVSWQVVARNAETHTTEVQLRASVLLGKAALHYLDGAVVAEAPSVEVLDTGEGRALHEGILNSATSIVVFVQLTLSIIDSGHLVDI